MSSIINSAPPPRPDIPDVHTLAAFAANQIIPDWTFLSAYRWYGSITGTPHILDAIAAICVTEQRPQPAAVALTIDNRLRQVRLLVTQGGVTEPDERLLSNMRKTWGLLRKHSEQAIKNRRQGLGQVHVTKPEQCLHRHIYLVKRVEVMRVIGEWWPKLDAADRQLGRSLRVSGEKVLESSPMSLFQHASLSLRKAVRMMGRDLSLVSPKSWQQVVSLMEIASGNCRAISDKWDDCEEWGPSFKDNAECKPPRARSALENLTSLHRQISTLTTFASSPCPSDIFSFKLEVSFLTCPSRPIALPTNWSTTIQSISMYSYHNSVPDTPKYTASAIELAATYATAQHGAAHPECNLISYLHTHRGGTTSPLGYIGLSTPTCAACNKWIALYTRRGMQCFRHRGSANTWSWPWVLMPGVDENDMARELMYSCHRYLRDHHLVHWRAPYSELEVLKRDDELLREKMKEMEIWWQENDGACLFGCTQVDGCSCFSVLYGIETGI